MSSANFRGGTSWLGPEQPLSPPEPQWWSCLCGGRHHVSKVVDFFCDWCERDGCEATGRVECSHCQRVYCPACATKLEMFREPNVCADTDCLQKEVARLRGLPEGK